MLMPAFTIQMHPQWSREGTRASVVLRMHQQQAKFWPLEVVPMRILDLYVLGWDIGPKGSICIIIANDSPGGMGLKSSISVWRDKFFHKFSESGRGRCSTNTNRLSTHPMGFPNFALLRFDGSKIRRAGIDVRLPAMTTMPRAVIVIRRRISSCRRQHPQYDFIYKQEGVNRVWPAWDVGD